LRARSGRLRPGRDRAWFNAVVEIELQYLYRSTEPIVVPTELAGFALAESLTFEIIDRFFDTADLELRRAGCSLRVRRQSNLPHPLLTWKGPSERREDGARQREEVEVPVDHVPADGAEIVDLLRRYSLWDVVRDTAGIGDDAEIEPIGELKNRRSSHLYVQGMHRLELTWDRLTFPVGEPQVRLEVETKRRGSARFIADVDADLRRLFGKRLSRAEHGKAKELCVRLYPEVFAAQA
jgi:inorganic triphosphatase YgiF